VWVIGNIPGLCTEKSLCSSLAHNIGGTEGSLAVILGGESAEALCWAHHTAEVSPRPHTVFDLWPTLEKKRGLKNPASQYSAFNERGSAF
jgi:hypothetical protein